MQEDVPERSRGEKKGISYIHVLGESAQCNIHYMYVHTNNSTKYYRKKGFMYMSSLKTKQIDIF